MLSYRKMQMFPELWITVEERERVMLVEWLRNEKAAEKEEKGTSSVVKVKVKERVSVASDERALERATDLSNLMARDAITRVAKGITPM